MKLKLNVIEYLPNFYKISRLDGKNEIEIFPIDKKIWPNLFEASINGVYVKEDSVKNRRLSHTIERKFLQQFGVNPQTEIRRVVREETSTEMTWEADGEIFSLYFSYDDDGKVLREYFRD
jgi:hypothetical protein